MSSVTDKVWQRNRALELHGAFTRLASFLAVDGAKLGDSLHALSEKLDGRTILAGWRPGKQGEQPRQIFKKIRCSVPTLRREWRRWNDGGCKPEALQLSYKYVAPRDGGRVVVPVQLKEEIQRRCTLKTGGRGKNGLTTLSAIYQWLRDDFQSRKPIPGINYDEIPDGADFPWSERTIARHAPALAERAYGNRGVAAFRQRAAFVQLDYSKLRKCELITFDDVRLDMLCIDHRTGKAIIVKCYIAMEVASRMIIAFIMKPAGEIGQAEVDELLAKTLQTPGFGLGRGYTTNLLFERGSIACSEAAQQVLEGATEGRLKIRRTSMDRGITWIGAERDRASGHAAGKAVIESFMRRLHSALIALPGQIGNNWANAPASVGFGTKTPDDPFRKPSKEETGTLVYEAERLAKFALEFSRRGKGRLRLHLPMLYYFQLENAVHAAIDRLNHEAGHRYADHGKFAQAEVEPGVWKETNEFTAPEAKKKVYVLDAPAKSHTPKQRNGMYWRLWKAAEAAQPGLNRFAVAARAIGGVKKITAMSDEEFLKVCHAFESIAKRQPA